MIDILSRLFSGDSSAHADSHFIEPVNIEKLQKRLHHRNSYKPNFELNFVMSHNGKIACFDDNRFYITDTKFTPELVYEATALANSCTISDNGNYAIFQTAFNQQNDEDSGAFAIVDIERKAVIKKGQLETGWRGITHLFIDETQFCFWVYYGESKVCYNFELQPDPHTLKRHIESGELGGYELLNITYDSMKKLKQGYDPELENEILNRLSHAALDKKTSHYQLSLACKELGQIYEAYGKTDKAAQAYRTGLALNPNLGVKRNLKQLEKDVPEARETMMLFPVNDENV